MHPRRWDLAAQFTFGHVNRLAAVSRAHLAALAARTELLPGVEARAFLDIDSHHQCARPTPTWR
jgi:hypothetical protein